jgi:hypothetical protein
VSSRTIESGGVDGGLPVAASSDNELRVLALQQVQRARRLKLRIAAYVVGLAVLIPVWIVAEYLSADGWPRRLSDNGNPGDWNPWIIWVALAWGFYVALSAVALHFQRPTSEAELEREIERLKSQR